MRWAISGGAGFLGLHLARRLLADGHEVRTLDVVPLDDPAREAIRSVNVEGTAVTLAAALEAGVRRAILISSTAVYGVPKVHPISEHAPLVGVGHYGESKIEAEQEALIAHAGSASRLRPVPARPAELALRALELLRLSPLAEWHYRTAHRDSFVDVSKAQRLLGFSPRLSNAQALCETYDWYLEHREQMRGAGVTHRVPWDQRALGLLKKIS